MADVDDFKAMTESWNNARRSYNTDPRYCGGSLLGKFQN